MTAVLAIGYLPSETIEMLSSAMYVICAAGTRVS
jgi:hypothetical protein